MAGATTGRTGGGVTVIDIEAIKARIASDTFAVVREVISDDGASLGDICEIAQTLTNEMVRANEDREALLTALEASRKLNAEAATVLRACEESMPVHRMPELRDLAVRLEAP